MRQVSDAASARESAQSELSKLEGAMADAKQLGQRIDEMTKRLPQEHPTYPKLPLYVLGKFSLKHSSSAPILKPEHSPFTNIRLLQQMSNCFEYISPDYQFFRAFNQPIEQARVQIPNDTQALHNLLDYLALKIQLHENANTLRQHILNQRMSQNLSDDSQPERQYFFKALGISAEETAEVYMEKCINLLLKQQDPTQTQLQPNFFQELHLMVGTFKKQYPESNVKTVLLEPLIQRMKAHDDADELRLPMHHHAMQCSSNDTEELQLLTHFPLAMAEAIQLHKERLLFLLSKPDFFNALDISLRTLEKKFPGKSIKNQLLEQLSQAIADYPQSAQFKAALCQQVLANTNDHDPNKKFLLSSIGAVRDELMRACGEYCLAAVSENAFFDQLNRVITIFKAYYPGEAIENPFLTFLVFSIKAQDHAQALVTAIQTQSARIDEQNRSRVHQQLLTLLTLTSVESQHFEACLAADDFFAALSQAHDAIAEKYDDNGTTACLFLGCLSNEIMEGPNSSTLRQKVIDQAAQNINPNKVQEGFLRILPLTLAETTDIYVQRFILCLLSTQPPTAQDADALFQQINRATSVLEEKYPSCFAQHYFLGKLTAAIIQHPQENQLRMQLHQYTAQLTGGTLYPMANSLTELLPLRPEDPSAQDTGENIDQQIETAKQEASTFFSFSTRGSLQQVTADQVGAMSNNKAAQKLIIRLINALGKSEVDSSQMIKSHVTAALTILTTIVLKEQLGLTHSATVKKLSLEIAISTFDTLKRKGLKFDFIHGAIGHKNDKDSESSKYFEDGLLSCTDPSTIFGIIAYHKNSLIQNQEACATEILCKLTTKVFELAWHSHKNPLTLLLKLQVRKESSEKAMAARSLPNLASAATTDSRTHSTAVKSSAPALSAASPPTPLSPGLSQRASSFFRSIRTGSGSTSSPDSSGNLSSQRSASRLSTGSTASAPAGPRRDSRDKRLTLRGDERHPSLLKKMKQGAVVATRDSQLRRAESDSNLLTGAGSMTLMGRQRTAQRRSTTLVVPKK